MAGGRIKKAGEKLDQGCLAGAVRSDKARHFPFAHGEVDLINGADCAETFAQPLSFYDLHRSALTEALPPELSDCHRIFASAGIPGFKKPCGLASANFRAKTRLTRSSFM